MDLIDEAYARAVEALGRCCTPAGLNASGRKHGHHQIWARDSMITLLGARFVENTVIRDALRASIELLASHQAASGAIPNNVDASSRKPNFRAYADGGLWWIIGSSLFAPAPETARSILAWYACQDVDQSGLLSMQEGADWQDLFCTRGKGLYVNCLYVLALQAAAKILPTESGRLTAMAESVAEKINRWFWYHGDGNMLPHHSHTFSTESRRELDSLGRKRFLPPKRRLVGEQYYLPYLGFRAVGEWFDSLGNLLAILSGAASPRQSGIILDFITRHGLDQRPLVSLIPAVRSSDPDWRDYYGTLNIPHHYHNGGIWPFIGGFYVAALVKMERMEAAGAALRRLAAMNLEGEFNEWHHGRTGEALGVRDQAWSAGMFIYAAECVRRGRVE
ncbi:MAG: hypothetical protein IT166_22530 [Bryobacterales bacterium]|nr:hypothetical protein [Bryobacterales bacterium]